MKRDFWKIPIFNRCIGWCWLNMLICCTSCWWHLLRTCLSVTIATTLLSSQCHQATSFPLAQERLQGSLLYTAHWVVSAWILPPSSSCNKEAGLCSSYIYNIYKNGHSMKTLNSCLMCEWKFQDWCHLGICEQCSVQLTSDHDLLFPSLWQYAWHRQLKGEIFILVHEFRGSSPKGHDPMHLDRKQGSGSVWRRRFLLHARQEVEQEEVRNKIPLESFSGNLLPPARSALLKFPKLSKEYYQLWTYYDRAWQLLSELPCQSPDSRTPAVPACHYA